jgi:hypothetical protein
MCTIFFEMASYYITTIQKEELILKVVAHHYEYNGGQTDLADKQRC